MNNILKTNREDLPQRNMLMSLRQLEIFRAIMIAGSITEAARMLFIAQPSVSRILQLTEERLGFLLFERIRGRLSPTPEAKRLFEEVEAAYAGVQRVDDLVRALVQGRSGELNVVCSPSLGVYLIPRAIARFTRHYPNLPIRFEPLTHNNFVPRMLFGKNYLGVTMFGVAHPNLESEPLAQAPILCAGPRGRFKDQAAVALATLQDEPWIGYADDTPLGQIFSAAFDGGAAPRPVVEVRSAISACRLVAEGVGYALVDPYCVDGALRAEIDVVPIAPALMVHVQAVYAHAEPLSHIARSFVGMLRDILVAEAPSERGFTAR